MNPLRKLYCRAYQLVFRIALPFLPYREPKLLDGVQGVADLLVSKNVHQVLLVTDKGIRSHGLTRPLEDALAEAFIGVILFDGTVANPTVANVEAARKLYLDHGCQAIIAFGGGSSMDCAKACGARIARPDRQLDRMEGLLHVMRPLPLLIAVPTTAGTGSETTLAAVITDGETHHKYPINDFALIPPYALLDPEVTIGLPPRLTATTGMDAMTHAVEAYIGGSTTRGTRQAAVEAVRLILESLPVAYEHGGDRTARAKMLRAAYLAGTAFTKSYVGYVHAVAHSLGGQYGIAHGLANAVLLPEVLEAYGPAAHKKLGRLAVETGVASVRDTPAQAAAKFIAKLRKMNADMGIPRTLEGIREEDLPMLARNADHEGNPLYPVPVLMDAQELQALYRLVMPKTEETANDTAGNCTGGAKPETILLDGENAAPGVSHRSA
ncbi:iron-containing alcohol dehydrogenase [uncultured Gemmiger sp.]|uniref:iron-containing alcohol dehydrogenase n=1 Tax=uncultured Gemmiger sp. TaxID=1623490 RepID=UPI0025E8ACDF|nr:iron-containing alcohol dehydrogenase [uncultured Gemmiger sp.]